MLDEFSHFSVSVSARGISEPSGSGNFSELPWDLNSNFAGYGEETGSRGQGHFFSRRTTSPWTEGLGGADLMSGHCA
jgi:hypothetical protein